MGAIDAVMPAAASLGRTPMNLDAREAIAECDGDTQDFCEYASSPTISWRRSFTI
jgi:hypothetical protein